jgi:hypothetical protein
MRLPSLFRDREPPRAAPQAPTPAAIDPGATAAAIILAGRRRRGEIECEVPPPQTAPPATVADPKALAAQIIEVGKRRRGELR